MKFYKAKILEGAIGLIGEEGVLGLSETVLFKSSKGLKPLRTGFIQQYELSKDVLSVRTDGRDYKFLLLGEAV